jgi:hypothetical protein
VPAPPDPFAEVAALDGVGAAAAHARDAIDALLRHPVMRRDAARVAAASATRGATASATLAGGDIARVEDPLLQGALRTTAEVPMLAARWMQSPRQVLARLHVLAARDLAEPASLGRPGAAVDQARFDQLLTLVVGETAAPAVVVAALVHGELLALRPFAPRDQEAGIPRWNGGSLDGDGVDGIVARAAERVVLVASGVDTKAVSVPEAGHHDLGRAYHPLLDAYSSGEPDGVAAWVRHCCEAYARGAEAGLAICVDSTM